MSTRVCHFHFSNGSFLEPECTASKVLSLGSFIYPRDNLKLNEDSFDKKALLFLLISVEKFFVFKFEVFG